MTLRIPAAALFLVCVTGARSTNAQVRFDARLGILASTNLVTDSIGTEPLTLRQNLAPTIGLAIDSRLAPHDRLGLTGSVARSNLVLHSPNGDRNLLVLTTWTPTLVLTHELGTAFAISAAAGAIIYDPDTRLGTVFSSDAPVKPLVGLGLHWRRLLGPSTAMGLDFSYDVHGFMTQTLITQGFSGQWVVQRASVAVTLGHRYDPNP